MQELIKYIRDLGFEVKDVSNKLTIQTYAKFNNEAIRNNFVLICKKNSRNKSLFKMLSDASNVDDRGEVKYYIQHKDDYIITVGLKDRINLLLKDKMGLRACKMCQKPPNNINDGGISEHRVCDCGYILCCECRDLLKTQRGDQLCCPSCNI